MTDQHSHTGQSHRDLQSSDEQGGGAATVKSQKNTVGSPGWLDDLLTPANGNPSNGNGSKKTNPTPAIPKQGPAPGVQDVPGEPVRKVRKLLSKSKKASVVLPVEPGFTESLDKSGNRDDQAFPGTAADLPATQPEFPEKNTAHELDLVTAATWSSNAPDLSMPPGDVPVTPVTDRLPNAEDLRSEDQGENPTNLDNSGDEAPVPKKGIRLPKKRPAPNHAKKPSPKFDPVTGKPIEETHVTSQSGPVGGIATKTGNPLESTISSPSNVGQVQAVQINPASSAAVNEPPDRKGITGLFRKKQGKNENQSNTAITSPDSPQTPATPPQVASQSSIAQKKVKTPSGKPQFDPATGKPIVTPESTITTVQAPGTVTPAITASPAVATETSVKPAGKLSGLFSVFKKKIPVLSQKTPAPEFNLGKLSAPSLDGALKDVDITYDVEEPFQYVHIVFDKTEGELLYKVMEPALGQEEQEALTIIERAFDKMISTNMDLIEGGQREIYLKEKFDQIISIFNLRVSGDEQQRMFFHLRKQYIGYGRIDTLMKDKYIEDISCNGSNMLIYVQHRIYGSIKTNVTFPEVELNNFVLKLAQISGRHISLLQPIRDVTLPDGSRANITLGGEVTKKGSTFTIRKFRSNPISPIELMDYSTVDAQQLAYLWILMEYKRSILVSGGTATGKTTFLNVLCSFIPDEYKIVSIEDTAELNLMHPNWIQSVTRTGFGAAEATSSASGISGSSRKAPGDILLYDLLTAALRQRPEFIIVGEVRGEEAFTLFQAIAVGHAALGTIHAGSMNELLARVESNPMNVPRSLLSNLDAVVFPMHIKKGERSMRRIANIVEILELDREQGDLITNTVYKWVPDIDVFRYQGRSFLFDKIRDTYGINKDLLYDELQRRTEFLLWMQRNGIRDYQEVIDLIRMYYRDKEEVKRRMAGGVPA
ncbi:MAG: ATPase, T2SS/T4P/T4SS family [Methanomicrobiales archaeon]